MKPVALLLLVAGCSGPRPPTVSCDRLTEVFVRHRAPLDVLVVVDPNASLSARDDDQLSHMFAARQAEWWCDEQDWRVTVVAANGDLTPVVAPGEPAVVSQDVGDLMANVRLATQPGGPELLLEAARGEPAGFFRPGARRAVELVATHEDASPGSVDSYRTVASVEVVAPGMIDSAACGGVQPALPRLKQYAANETACDLCEAQGRARVTGQLCAGLQRHDYLLTEEATPGSIVVRSSGKELPRVNSRGEEEWSFDATQNRVTVHQLFGPEPEEQLEIEYQPRCAFQ